jgi:hypothetical protein
MSAKASVIGFDGASFGDFTGFASEDGFTYTLFSGALFTQIPTGNPGGNMQWIVILRGVFGQRPIRTPAS